VIAIAIVLFAVLWVVLLGPRVAPDCDGIDDDSIPEIRV